MLFFKVFDDAVGGRETKCTAAGKHDRVDFFDEIGGIEKICFASARGAAANIDASDGALLGKDDRASGWALAQRVMADFDSGYGCEGLVTRTRTLRRQHRRPVNEQNQCSDGERNRRFHFKFDTSVSGRPAE